MLLFIILSVYAALLVTLIIATVIAKRIPGGEPVTRYLIAGTVGTLLGFAIANGLVLVAGIAPVLLAEKFTLPQWLNYTGAVAVAGILFIGPIFASVIGVIAGFAAGLYYAFKRGRKSPPIAGQIAP